MSWSVGIKWLWYEFISEDVGVGDDLCESYIVFPLLDGDDGTHAELSVRFLNEFGLCQSGAYAEGFEFQSHLDKFGSCLSCWHSCKILVGY